MSEARGIDAWYYSIGGMELGPVSFDDLLDLGRTEQIAADDMVKLGADGKWRRAASIGRLMAVLPFQETPQKSVAKFEPVAVAVSRRASVEPAVESQPSGTATAVVGAEYETAYEQAKEKIAGLILAQADAAFKAAESQAQKEYAWALAPNVDPQWWGWAGSVEFGPVTFPQVLALARNGQLQPTDFVRNGAAGQFVAASRVPGLYNAVAILARAAESQSLAQAQAKAAAELAIPAIEKPRAPVAQRVELSPESAAVSKSTRDTSPVVETVRGNASKTHGHTARTSPEISAAPPTSPPTSAPAPAPVDPTEAVLSRAREALNSKNIVAFQRLQLDFRQGVLTVRGDLGSEGERLYAVRLLNQVEGVQRVEELINVASSSGRPVAPARGPVPTPVARARSGPGLGSQLQDALSAIPATKVAIALLVLGGLGGGGYWCFGNNPARPVSVHPVKGKIVIDGTPLANASVVLHRVGESRIPANLHPRARAGEDGSFALETFDPADGAPNGEFVATVFLHEAIEVNGEKQAGPNVLPVLYSRPETSPLKLRITSSTRELEPLELTRK
jgi:hypothetical protein